MIISNRHLIIFKLGVDLSEEHSETAHVLLGGLDTTDNLILFSRAALQQTRAERRLFRRPHRVVHRTQARTVVAEIRLTNGLRYTITCGVENAIFLRVSILVQTMVVCSYSISI